ncbi:MAG: glycosyltransferase [Acidobacteria bacterium]|jgi:glycosyltransferase involved in cell wall biosynthesis|nr:glycosyltransferase [Acidobacteriota bacterium]
MREVVVMVATSYPRFPGDGVGSFMEPIAKSVAALGHEVHMVAPWHPAITRGRVEDGVFFHFFKYAPVASLNVFGYAGGLRADTDVRATAWAVAPAAVAAGWFKAWRVAHKRRATVMHGHWVIPGGVIAAAAARRLPLALSLHGSDVFVAERHPLIGALARRVFERAGAVTACSDDLHHRAIALGADPTRTETVPYGVDTTRFAPDPSARADIRTTFALGEGPLLFTGGRLVSKKGFEYLIDALRQIHPTLPGLQLVIAGDGDLAASLRARASGLPVRFVGAQSQDMVARFNAAADIVVVPSVRDDAGNVDGLPNFALEALASATPVVATIAGGLPQAITDGDNGLLVPERDAGALAAALTRLLASPDTGHTLGASARARVLADHSWTKTAERMVAAYARARLRD